MNYQSSNTKQIYSIDFEKDKKKRYRCPECSDNRRKKNVKDLEFYPDSGRAFCFHCETTFFEYQPYEKKEYVAPEWKNKTDLSDKAVKYFESRMISQTTLKELNIYSDTEWMPQFQKEMEVICFPYFRDGELVNIKYRGPKKSFKLHSGSELIFWNLDTLKNNDSCVICEGEIDALTYYENGFKNVISVPNGANKNLEYLDNCIGYFEQVSQVYLSTDNDTKGIELRDELIRRIGIEKCYLINLKECKDANEFVVNHTGNELKDAVKNAQVVPVDGAVTVQSMYNDLLDLYQNGIQPGKTIDVPEIDEYCTWDTSKFVVVTGEPGMGKSEFVDFINAKLNLLQGWKVAYFSPENYPLKFHYAKIFEKIIGRKFKSNGPNDVEFDMAYEYIKENFFYILNENDLTLDKILEVAKYYIRKHGIRILVIDPYNKLDHQYSNGETETQYISKFLDKLINFTRFNDILTFLIAHPTKLPKGDIPNLYSISGSSHFYNKADYGFTFHRKRDEETNVLTNDNEVHWQKFRFKHLGTSGISELAYNLNNGRFKRNTGQETEWDNSNWLIKSTQTQIENEIPGFWNEINESDDPTPF